MGGSEHQSIESNVLVETPLLEVAAEIEPEAFMERKDWGVVCRTGSTAFVSIVVFILT